MAQYKTRCEKPAFIFELTKISVNHIKKSITGENLNNQKNKLHTHTPTNTKNPYDC